MINGIIYDNQIPTAKGFRCIINRMISDGVVDGCAISVGDDSVTINAGYYHCCGGEIFISESETLSLPHASRGYVRIKAVIDITLESSPSAFNQFFFEVESAVDDLFDLPELRQDNINIDGIRYEAEFCIIDMTKKALYRYQQATPKIVGSVDADGVLNLFSITNDMENNEEASNE